MSASAGQIRAGRAYVELGTEDSALERGLDRAAQKLQAWGATVRNIGLGVTAAAAAVTAPLTALAYRFADTAQNLLRASQRTGVAIESLSELAYAAQQTGTDFESLETGLKKLNVFMYQAAGGSAEARLAMMRLGVSLGAITNKNPEERFKVFADALAGVRDPGVQAALAVQLFGRNGTALLPLLQQGAAGINQWQQRARALNITNSTQSVQAAAAFKMKLNDLTNVLESLGQTIADAVIPVLQRNAELFTRLAVDAINWTNAHKPLIATIFRVASAVGILGVGITALGVAIQGAGKVMSVLSAVSGAAGAVLSAMLTPLGLVVTGLAALGGYLVYTSGTGSAAIAGLRRAFNDLKTDAVAAFRGINNAIDAGRWALAAKIALNLVRIEFERGLILITNAIQQGAGPIAAAWSNLLTLLGQLTQPMLAWLGTSWSQVWAGFTAGLQKALGYAVYAFSFLELLIKGWRWAVDIATAAGSLAFLKLWENVRFYAVTTFDWLGKALPALFSIILDKLQAKLSDWLANVVGAMVRLYIKTVAPALPSAAANAAGNAAAATVRSQLSTSGGSGPPATMPPPPNYSGRQKTPQEIALEAMLAAYGPKYFNTVLQGWVQKNQQTVNAALAAVNNGIVALGQSVAGGVGKMNAQANQQLQQLLQQRQQLLLQAAPMQGPPGPPPGWVFRNGHWEGPPGANYDLSGLSPSSRGTFNAGAIQSLQGSSEQVQRDIRTNTKNTSEAIKDLARALRSGNGGGFSFNP